MNAQSRYLHDETAVITGSGNAIGRALALEVAGEAAGCKVNQTVPHRDRFV